MACLVISALALIEFKGFLPKGRLKHDLVYLHMQAGLLVFSIFWIRLYWRTTHPVPAVTPPLSPMQKKAAALIHAVLYLMRSFIPVLGVLALQSKGKAVDFFGHALPVLLDEDKWLPYALRIRNFHELAGDILIGLILFHVAAALLHHLFRRDDTLRRMLPGFEHNMKEKQ
jgi:cytochrome b561